RITQIMIHRPALRLGWSRTVLLTGAAAIAVIIPVIIGAQQAREEFEVASIRPSDPNAAPSPGSRGGGGGPCLQGAPQIDPQHFTISNATLFSLIVLAYGGESSAPVLNCMRWSKYGMLSGGPDWVRTQKFTIQAVMPAGFPRYTNFQLWEAAAPRLQGM